MPENSVARLSSHYQPSWPPHFLLPLSESLSSDAWELSNKMMLFLSCSPNFPSSHDFPSHLFFYHSLLPPSLTPSLLVRANIFHFFKLFSVGRNLIHNSVTRGKVVCVQYGLRFPNRGKLTYFRTSRDLSVAVCVVTAVTVNIDLLSCYSWLYSG
jgi:hypothetical protein